ncbi:MAG: hypothetical protein M0Z47_10615 [Actinomycetota bacterium]|nr:hypothetical protein [Actinomycetota bacterium]
MPGASSKTLLELTEEALKDSHFEYERIPDTDAYSIDYNFEDVNWMIFVQVVENLGLVIAYSSCPFSIDQAHQAQVMEFSSRLNYVLFEGGFEMDTADGDLRFKTSTFVGSEASPTTLSEGDIQALIQHTVFSNIFVATISFPSVAKIVRGLISVDEAVIASSDLG